MTKRSPSSHIGADIVNPAFRLESDWRLDIYYAPMDGLGAGQSAATVLNAAKSCAAFSGMRRPLVARLDYLGVARHLGLLSAAELWMPVGERHLHSTSAIRYPAFVDGKDYGGRTPRLTSHPLLRRYVYELLAPELATIPDAFVIPLGVSVEAANSGREPNQAPAPRERVVSRTPPFPERSAAGSLPRHDRGAEGIAGDNRTSRRKRSRCPRNSRLVARKAGCTRRHGAGVRSVLGPVLGRRAARDHALGSGASAVDELALALSKSNAQRDLRRGQHTSIGVLSFAVNDEATTRHLHGIQRWLRCRVGRHPPPRAASVGFSELEHASARVQRMVDGMDVGHDRANRLSTAQTAHACPREAAPQHLDRARRARPRRHRPHAGHRQATARKQDRRLS